MKTNNTPEITTGQTRKNNIIQFKNIKLAVLAVVIAAGFSSCVVSAHPYGSHWVPGHYVPGYYHEHWVPGHWS